MYSRYPRIKPITQKDIWGDDGRDSKRTLSPGDKKVVYERDGGRCRVCDKLVPFQQAEFGHDRAHSKGGRTTVRNALTLHAHHNTMMRTKSLNQIRKELGLPVKEKPKTKATKRKKRRSSDNYYDRVRKEFIGF
jgi:hypothetical protein